VNKQEWNSQLVDGIVSTGAVDQITESIQGHKLSPFEEEVSKASY